MIKLALSFLKKYPFHFSIYILIQFILTTASILNPYLSGLLIDCLTISKSLDSLIFLIALLAIAQIVSLFLQYIQSLVSIRFQIYTSSDFIQSVIEHLENAKKRDLEKLDLTAVNQQINNDCNSLIIFVYQNVSQLCLHVVQIIFYVWILSQINFLIFVVVVCSTALYYIYFLLYKHKLEITNKTYLDAQTKYFACYFNWLKHWKFFKFYEDSFIRNEAKKRTREITKASLDKQRTGFGFLSIDTISKFIPQMLLYLSGGIQVISGKMTIGELVASLSYLEMLLDGLESFFSFASSYEQEKAGYKRIKNCLNLQKENFGKNIGYEIDGIEVKNIFFSYKKEKPVLSGFSQKFEKGKVYWLKGENGKGKTTLLNILAALHNGEYSRDIEINFDTGDFNIKDIDLEWYRKKQISYLFQESSDLNPLIDMNLKKRINTDDLKNLYVNFDIQNIQDVSKKKIHAFSGGEHQKLTLFSILSEDKPILLLDEPTNNLDQKSIEAFFKALNTVKENKIILIVSHDTRLKAAADQIIHL